VLNSIKEGQQVDSVYMNFSKAFDRCLWLRSYSTERIQRIRISDAVSKDIRVTSGVSLGSYLGPLCFIGFVNRISVIFEYVRLLFYAHDMKLFLLVSGFQDCIPVFSRI
jgi:hypothetical protein